MKPGLAHSLGIVGGGVISLVGAGGKTTLMFQLARELWKSGAPVLATTTTKIRVPPSGDVACCLIAPDPNEVLRQARHIGGCSGPILAAAKEIFSEKKLVGFPPEAVDFIADSRMFRWIVVEADGAGGRPVKAPAPHEPVIPEGSDWVIGVLGLDAVGRPLNDSCVFRPERFSAIAGLSMGKPISAHALAKALMHPEGILKGRPKGSAVAVFLNKADTPEAVSIGREIIARLKEMKRPSICRAVIGRLLPDPMVHEYHEIGNAGENG